MDIFDELRDEGRTIIMVTHGMDIAERAGRIISIKDGYLQDGFPGKKRVSRRRGSRSSKHSG